MNKIIITILFIFSFYSLSAQYKIDENLSITFPGVPKIEKSGSVFVKATSYSFNTTKESYIVIKTEIENKNLPNILFPNNKDELHELYKKGILWQIKIMERKKHTFSDSLKTSFHNLLGYKLIYKDKFNGGPGAESLIICLNGKRYDIIYAKVSEFNEINKNKFFQSIILNHPQDIKQVSNLKVSKKINYRELLLKLGFFIVLIYLLIKYSKDKSSFGINLNTTICPNCQSKIPKFRIPKNISQAMNGGSTCKKCNTNLDKFGNIIL